MILVSENLWNEYHHQKRYIAEAFVRGQIQARDKTFVMELIDEADIEAAKQTISRKFWATELRLAQLEMEVETLRTHVTRLRMSDE